MTTTALEKALLALRELVEQIDRGPAHCVGLDLENRLGWQVTFADRVDALRPLVTPRPAATRIGATDG